MQITRAVACLLASGFFLLFPSLGAAQSERATISGIVTDSTKAGLPGVTVTITNTGTNQATEVITAATGGYTAPNLAPGRYRIEAALTGFGAKRIDELQLNSGASARADFSLDVGTISEQVTVTASSPLLQTSDARAATNMSNELIDKLPLVVGGAMRSVFDLVSTVAESRGTGNAVALGGGQGGAFGATLDGISVNTNRNANTVETAFLTPSVEAITEFAVFKMPQIKFINKGINVTVATGEDFLEMQRKYPDLPLTFGCTRGECGTCVVKILHGMENLTKMSTLERETLRKKSCGSGYRLACQIAVNGNIEIE